MKVYIAKCDRAGEEVPFSKYAEGGPWYYKDFWMWIFHEPEKTEDGTHFVTSNAITMTENELREQFFSSNKDWAYFQEELDHVKKNPNYYFAELDLFVV